MVVSLRFNIDQKVYQISQIIETTSLAICLKLGFRIEEEVWLIVLLRGQMQINLAGLRD